MAIDSITPRSRRALLAAAAGSLAALAAQALGRPLPARAGFDGDVVLGAANTATTSTSIYNSTNDYTVLWGASISGIGVVGDSDTNIGVSGTSGSWYGVSGSSGSSIGVHGDSGTSIGVQGYSSSSIGVQGESNSGIGVWGESTSSDGVYGYSSSSIGVRGGSSASDKPATVGQSYGGGTGVLGYSGTGTLPAPAKTGVHGYAVQDSSSRGVWGRANAGRGVFGQATSGRGVSGYASSGVGGYFSAGAGGTAFEAAGAVRFSSSGTATIAGGTKSKLVNPSLELTSASKVLVTLMGNPGATVHLHRVIVDAAADSFTVYLTANAAASTKFAWFVIS